MNIELNSGWPKTKAAIEDYERALLEFRAEIVDGEPTIDAFFMAVSMAVAAEKITKALGKEYMAKQPSLIRQWLDCFMNWLRR